MFKLPRFEGNCCVHLQGIVEKMETAVSSYEANCIASHPRKLMITISHIPPIYKTT
jgi:hypothetical protein